MEKRDTFVGFTFFSKFSDFEKNLKKNRPPMSPKMKLSRDIPGIFTSDSSKDSFDFEIWKSGYLRHYMKRSPTKRGYAAISMFFFAKIQKVAKHFEIELS